ncbi:MAG: U32 family peptidase, partial [Alphaproteobacteria bacterium]|nr:U32 family peptidase [Alphaproteobacteria bacterium]
AETRRDFYFRIADEAPIDTVCLGEVVCSKRSPFIDPVLPEIVERLEAAGKAVVYSTLALIMSPAEMDAVRDLAAAPEFAVEANDLATAGLLAGRPHWIGPFVNVYNEGTLEFLVRRGAERVCLPVELPAASISALAGLGLAAIEVFAFGRMPLALSARCYHARAHGLHKDGCQYVCAPDLDGMAVESLTGQSFLAVNGTQTLSYTLGNLLAEVPALQRMGVASLRLSPHDVDMVAVAKIFRAVADAQADPDGRQLDPLVGDMPFANGFYHGVEGLTLVE